MKPATRKILLFLMIPIWLAPFAIAIASEAHLDAIPIVRLENFLFFGGKYIFFLSYLNKNATYSIYMDNKYISGYGITPVFPIHPYFPSVTFWGLASIAYGYLAQRLRLLHAFALAPVAIALSTIFSIYLLFYVFGFFVHFLPIIIVNR